MILLSWNWISVLTINTTCLCQQELELLETAGNQYWTIAIFERFGTETKVGFLVIFELFFKKNTS